MLRYIKNRLAVNRIREEKLYEIVAKEMKHDQIRDGLWTKAVEESEGNESLAKSLYIKYRIQSLKDELEITENLAEIAKKQPQAKPILKIPDATDKKALLKESLETDQVIEHQGEFYAYGKKFPNEADALAYITESNKYQ